MWPLLQEKEDASFQRQNKNTWTLQPARLVLEASREDAALHLCQAGQENKRRRMGKLITYQKLDAVWTPACKGGREEAHLKWEPSAKPVQGL